MITVKNVRIIYPVLTPVDAEAHFKRSSFQNEGGAKMSAKFLLCPEKNRAAIDAIDARATEIFKEEKWGAGMAGLSHVCLKEGDTMPDKEGQIPEHYNGMFVLNGKAYLDNPIIFIGTDGKPVDYEAVKGSFYNGARCNIQIMLSLSKKYKVLSAVIRGIQPLPGGERMALGGVSPEVVAAAFDDVGDEWAEFGDAEGAAA